MLVIGSQAMNYFGLGHNRAPGDWDIIGTVEEFEKFCNAYKDRIVLNEILSVDKQHVILKQDPASSFNGHIEWEFAWVGSTGQELHDIVMREGLFKYIGSPVGLVMMANPDVQLTVKSSHKYRKNFKHFKKTLDDIIKLKSEGAVIPDVLVDWLSRREAETYTNKHPNLKQLKKDFFDTPGVEYKYDHDSIHRAVARFDLPCYTYFKDDQAEVFCSKAKFFEQDFEVQLGSVVEESLVLALERCLVPYKFNTNPKTAFLMALEKVCTSISSGWWREFAYDHYYDAIELFDNQYKDFVDSFMDGLYNGTIKLHEVAYEPKRAVL